MGDEQRQTERLHALLAGFEAESEAEEFLDLAVLAEEIRLLGAPRLSAERRGQAREQALRAFRSQWTSPATEEAEPKEEQLPVSSVSGLDEKTLQRIQEELAKGRERWRQAASGADTRAAPTPVRGKRVAESSESLWRRLRLERRQLFKVLGLAGLATLFKGLFTRAHPLPPATAASGGLGDTSLRAMTVKTVMPDPVKGTTNPVMLLEAVNLPGRMLPIWIGQPEATAISLVLEDQAFPRPMTHDLFLKALDVVGAQLDHVRITHIEGGTYYAAIVLRDMEGGLGAVDARPSDAVALAARARCPVYAADQVLEQGGISVAAGEDEPEGE